MNFVGAKKTSTLDNIQSHVDGAGKFNNYAAVAEVLAYVYRLKGKM